VEVCARRLLVGRGIVWGVGRGKWGVVISEDARTRGLLWVRVVLVVDGWMGGFGIVMFVWGARCEVGLEGMTTYDLRFRKLSSAETLVCTSFIWVCLET
jgi:hypothetical protein